jgi:hypothetical protein
MSVGHFLRNACNLCVCKCIFDMFLMPSFFNFDVDHVGCVRNRDADKLKISPEENWFCCKKCEQVF